MRIPVVGLAAFERDIWFREGARFSAENAGRPFTEEERGSTEEPLPARGEEVPYYAHRFAMANLAFRLGRVETWVPHQHFEPEATDPSDLQQVLAVFWAKVQRRFFEKLERHEVAVRDLPYHSHEDLQDMDGTVYRLFYRVEYERDVALVYTRARPLGHEERLRAAEKKEEEADEL